MKKISSTSVIISLFFGVSYSSLAAGANNGPQTASHNVMTGHVIEAGDNLYMVSATYNITMAHLQAWNNIDDVNQIALGQNIRLQPPTMLQTGSATSDASAAGDIIKQSAAKRTQETAPPDNSKDMITGHVIEAGDNLYTVSATYNITMAHLQAWNNIDDVNQIALGQNIRLQPPTMLQTGSATSDASAAGDIIKPSAAKRTQETPPPDNSKDVITEHVIVAGENLYTVSAIYNITMAHLKAWNNINDVNQVAVGQKISLRDPLLQPTATGPIGPDLTGETRQKIQTALANAEYRLAISLLTRLFKQGSLAEQQFALEFLGVAREKNGQKAFAKQAYQVYLNKYPDSETAPRVKGRLDSLIGIETLSKDRTLKKGQRKTRKSNTSFTRGSLATDYRKGMLTNNNGDTQDTMSLLSLDLDARGRYQIDNYELGFRASLGRYQDLMDDPDDPTERIRYLHFSAKSKDNLYQIKLGRQRSRGKGIFGRFDGAVLTTQWQPGIQFNVVAGYPVASTKELTLDPERQFYGLSMDIDNWWSGIDLSLFVFNQSINDLTDRRAIGGELSYYQDRTSVNAMFDYDIFFNQLNALLLSGSYATASQQRFSWSVNYRKSPYMGTRNALIGQSADSLAELQSLFITDEEILDLALDRTLESKSATLQFSQPLGERYSIDTSITWMNLSGAPESGGVPEIGESGDQYYMNLSLRANKLYSENDVNSLGLRYSSLSNSEVYSVYATSRYRWDNSLTIMQKLRFDSRNNSNGTSQKNIAPTLRLQYQTPQHYFYGDFGAIFYTSESVLFPTQESSLYFLYLGYRLYY